MAPLLAPSTLDTVLALQITVAWAGEGRSQPSRLGWWQTDLVDEAGGGDLLARLLPRTHSWASLEAVRESARRADAMARKAMAPSDSIHSLFFLGFEIDERLAERLGSLKRAGASPQSALPFPISLSAPFNRDALTEALRQPGSGDAPYTVTPGGRQLKEAMPTSLELAVRNLAAALLPLPEQYPLPFYRVSR
jgi:hypothetical protein